MRRSLAAALIALAGVAPLAATPLGMGDELPGAAGPVFGTVPPTVIRIDVVRAGLIDLPAAASAMTEADAARILRACGYFRRVVVEYHQRRGATTPLEGALMAFSWGSTYRRPAGPVALDLRMKEAVLAQGRLMNAARTRHQAAPEISTTATAAALERWIGEAGEVLASLPRVARAPLLKAVVYGETRGIHWKQFVPLIGYSGEIGLGQIMPRSAAALGVNAYDPQENLKGIATYLERLMRQHGNLRKAIACYAAGNNPGPEAYAHADRVIARARGYLEAGTQAAD